MYSWDYLHSLSRRATANFRKKQQSYIVKEEMDEWDDGDSVSESFGLSAFDVRFLAKCGIEVW